MMIRRLPTLSSHYAVGGRGRIFLNLFFTEDTTPINNSCTNNTQSSNNYSTTSSINKKMNSSTYSYRKKKQTHKIQDDLLMLNSSTKKHKIQALKQQIDMLSNEVHQPTTHTEKRKKVNKPVYKKPTNPMPMNKKGPYSIFISCLPGLEPLLLSEVQYLLQQTDDSISDQKQSNKQTKKVPGGVTTIIPSLSYIHLLHLYLGTASHIYLRLNDNNHNAQLANIPSTFTALGFPELKRKVKDLIVAQRWDDLLLIPKKKNGSNMAEEVVEASELPWKLSVHVTTSKSKLIHTKAVEERVRDVIGNVLGINGLYDKEKSDTKDDDNRPTIRLLVRIERDEVQLSLDTSTLSSSLTNTSVSPMHMRGYRLDPYKAPLREDLAFALLLVGGVKPSWDLSPLDSLLGKKSNISIDTKTEDEEQTGIQLFDPLCGSGTIAIEGASILAGLPPGRFRSPPLQGTSLYNEKMWNDMRSKALSVASGVGKEEDTSNTTVLVAANDINSNAISAAQSNAQRAGADHLIHFQVGSFKTHPLLNPSRKSVKTSTSNPLKIVTNPPYGKRISNTTQSKSSIYKQIAKSIKHSKLDNVECTLIGKDIRSLRESSLPLDVGFSTRHGGLGVIAMTSSSFSSSVAESNDS